MLTKMLPGTGFDLIFRWTLTERRAGCQPPTESQAYLRLTFPVVETLLRASQGCLNALTAEAERTGPALGLAGKYEMHGSEDARPAGFQRG